jgi:hypothetical protein
MPDAREADLAPFVTLCHYFPGPGAPRVGKRWLNGLEQLSESHPLT